MRIIDPINLRKFAGVKFIYGDPATGNRIKLDPKDFNEMQDIWLQYIDDLLQIMRGGEGGILNGCQVTAQQATLTQATSGYEIVVSPGEIYVNGALINIRLPTALPVPIPLSTDTSTWEGFKTFYLIFKPELREFVPTNLGDPGMSNLAGRKTSHRIEIGGELLLQDAFPGMSTNQSASFLKDLVSSYTANDWVQMHGGIIENITNYNITTNIPWFVLLAEVRIKNPMGNYQEDIIVSQNNAHRLMLMSDIQTIATNTAAQLLDHASFYYLKKSLIGQIDGINRQFTLPVPLIRGAETTDIVKNDYNGVLRIYANDQLVSSQNYLVNKIENTVFDANALANNSAANNTTNIVFNISPIVGTTLTASYYPERHPMYLSFFSFLQHIDQDSLDHDNRYYNKAEENIWRTQHNSDLLSHPTHLLASDFNSWKTSHISSNTTEHNNAYARIEHLHTIEDTYELTNQINKFGQEIGYNADNHYIVTQQISAGIDGVNTTFPLHSDLLRSEAGWIKQIRADITNDGIINPAVLNVIDISQNFQSPSVAAFSEQKSLTLQYINNIPRIIAQSDGEIWVVWGAKESEVNHKIWFCSYKSGDGYFSPPTSTNLICDPIDRYPSSINPQEKYPGLNISATVIYSAIPAINQQIAIVWEYNQNIRYASISKGQSEWTPLVQPIPGTTNCHSPSIAWIDDGTSAGKLYLTYTKLASTGKMAIFLRKFEINFIEIGQEEMISSNDVNHYSPIIVQDKSPSKRIWYAWVVEKDDGSDPNFDNSHRLSIKITDRTNNATYKEESVVNDINFLNMRSDISMTSLSNGMWLQFSKIDNGAFNIYYKELDFNANSLNANSTLLAIGQHHGVVRADNDEIWCVYDDITRIKYRARQTGAGEVKWDKSIPCLVFEHPPVARSIIKVDIAVPIRSLNERLSVLESRGVDSEEVLAIKIMDIVASMGLEMPQERLRQINEKVAIEAETTIDTRCKILNYDRVIYNKFFYPFDSTHRRPKDISPTVLKSANTATGFNTTSFEYSGLIYDIAGKIINPTGHIIKIYSGVEYEENFVCGGELRLEAHGDLQCLSFRITPGMDVDVTGQTTAKPIPWINIANNVLSQDLNLSANDNFRKMNKFGIEITIKPGGYIYDWALFLKKKR